LEVKPTLPGFLGLFLLVVLVLVLIVIVGRPVRVVIVLVLIVKNVTTRGRRRDGCECHEAGSVAGFGAAAGGEAGLGAGYVVQK